MSGKRRTAVKLTAAQINILTDALAADAINERWVEFFHSEIRTVGFLSP